MTSSSPMASGSAGVVAQASASAPALPFRRADADVFPTGGALLLIALVAVACGGWITAWRRRGLAGWAGRGPGATGSAGMAASQEAPRVISTRRLDAATRLHVIEWRDRRLLVATTGSAPPVVLDRAPRGGSPS